MKACTLAALVLVGAGLAAPSAGAMPKSGISSEEWSNLVSVANKSSKKRKKNHNYSSAKGYIPGYVLTPYGRGDCIGWWEPLANGLMRCNGQFLPYRY
jgi:hypothetical protein